MSKLSYWVYVLQSQYDKSLYVGNAQDIPIRLKQHNQGRCRSTKARRLREVIHREKFDSRSDAVKRERFLKSGVGRKELKLLVSL